MAEKKTAHIEAVSEPILYEVGFLLTPATSEEDVSKETAAIRSFIEDNGGEVSSEGAPSLIKLAYAIEHKSENKKTTHDSAYFGWMQFRVTAGSIQAIEGKLTKKEEIIRFLLIKADEMPVAPSRSLDEIAGEEVEALSETELDDAIKELVS